MIQFIFAMVLAQSAGATTTAHVTLKNSKGESVGTVKIFEIAKGVRMDVEVKGLSPGEHGFHVHENGTCTAPDFKSAGGHYNPSKKAHGFDVPNGHHGGDMPNLIAGADGEAHAQIFNMGVSLNKKSRNSLLKSGGTAIVIHEKADDQKSQPAGDAGGRVACGEIH